MKKILFMNVKTYDTYSFDSKTKEIFISSGAGYNKRFGGSSIYLSIFALLSIIGFGFRSVFVGFSYVFVVICLGLGIVISKFVMFMIQKIIEKDDFVSINVTLDNCEFFFERTKENVEMIKSVRTSFLFVRLMLCTIISMMIIFTLTPLNQLFGYYMLMLAGSSIITMLLAVLNRDKIKTINKLRRHLSL